MKSIIQKDKECYFCHTTLGLHCHHIFFGSANRKISERNGFKVYLCNRHHENDLKGNDVHHNYEMNLRLKQDCQREYEKTHSRKEFMELIGKNYLKGN